MLSASSEGLSAQVEGVLELTAHFSPLELNTFKVKTRTVYAYDYKEDAPSKTARPLLREAYDTWGNLVQATYSAPSRDYPLKEIKITYSESGCLSRKLETSYQDSVISRTVYTCDSLNLVSGSIQYGPTGKIHRSVQWIRGGDHHLLQYKWKWGRTEIP